MTNTWLMILDNLIKFASTKDSEFILVSFNIAEKIMKLNDQLIIQEKKKGLLLSL